jgi:hypothetical protein
MSPLERAVKIIKKGPLSTETLQRVERYIIRSREVGLGINVLIEGKTILDYLLEILLDNQNKKLTGLIGKVVRLGAKAKDPLAMGHASRGGLEIVKLVYSTGASIRSNSASWAVLQAARQNRKPQNTKVVVGKWRLRGYPDRKGRQALIEETQNSAIRKFLEEYFNDSPR